MRTLVTFAACIALAACAQEPRAPLDGAGLSSPPTRPGALRSTVLLELAPPSSDSFGLTADERYVATALTKLQVGGWLDEAVREAELHTRPEFAGMNASEVARLLDGRVGWRRLPGTYLVEIYVEGEREVGLDGLANLCAGVFRSSLQTRSTELRLDRRARAEENIAKANTKLRLYAVDKRGALEFGDFTESTFEAEYRRILLTRERYVEALEETKLWLSDETRRVRLYRGHLTEGDAGLRLLGARGIANDAVIVEQLEVESELRDRLQRLTHQGLGSQHPDVQEMQAELRANEARVLKRARRIADELVEEFEEREANAARLQERIDELTSQLRRATDVKARVDQIAAEMDRLEDEKQRATVALERLAPGPPEDLAHVVRAARPATASR